VTAGRFQRRGTAATIGDQGSLPSGADPEREAPGFPSNTILAVTDGQALYAFHRDPRDGLIGRWPLGKVGAKLDARESNLNYLAIAGTWELLLSFRDGRSAAFECSKRNDVCKATRHAIAAGAAELTRNLPRPRGRSIQTSPTGTRTTWTPGTNGSCWSPTTKTSSTAA